MWRSIVNLLRAHKGDFVTHFERSNNLLLLPDIRRQR